MFHNRPIYTSFRDCHGTGIVGHSDHSPSFTSSCTYSSERITCINCSYKPTCFISEHWQNNGLGRVKSNRPITRCDKPGQYTNTTWTKWWHRRRHRATENGCRQRSEWNAGSYQEEHHSWTENDSFDTGSSCLELRSWSRALRHQTRRPSQKLHALHQKACLVAVRDNNQYMRELYKAYNSGNADTVRQSPTGGVLVF